MKIVGDQVETTVAALNQHIVSLYKNRTPETTKKYGGERQPQTQGKGGATAPVVIVGAATVGHNASTSEGNKKLTKQLNRLKKSNKKLRKLASMDVEEDDEDEEDDEEDGVDH
jgi:hypothetical protein